MWITDIDTMSPGDRRMYFAGWAAGDPETQVPLWVHGDSFARLVTPSELAQLQCALFDAGFVTATMDPW